MNILYIAYSCSPEDGSEDRIGWKIPATSAKINNIFVITKQEHRDTIQRYLHTHFDLQKIQFYYVDIPAIYKKIFRGFAYSGRLNIWHRNALKLAEKICATEQIDIIHQVTPVEFRSIGDYGRIPGVKFVCGPVGGGEYIPAGLQYYASAFRLQESVRKLLNELSLQKLKRSGILERCDCLLVTNQETANEIGRILPHGHKKMLHFTEIGIDQTEIVGKQPGNEENAECVFLIAGRLIYRKGHALALDAFRALPQDLKWKCNIVGMGAEYATLQRKIAEYKLGDKVHLLGKIPFSAMAQIYSESDVLLMPSLRETTGSVLLEAMARGLPVVTIGQFGGAGILDSRTGWLYLGETRTDFVDTLKDCLVECVSQPQEVKQRSEQAVMSAKKHTWDKKSAYYQSIYEELIQKAEG